MAIDLLALQPHKVSRDLSGYITYIYGAPKCGKTTLAAQMEKPLLLAFEPGYHALPGIVAQDITSWAEMKQVYPGYYILGRNEAGLPSAEAA